MYDNSSAAEAMTIRLDAEYPPNPVFEPGIRRAPSRGFRLTDEQTRTALRNALRLARSRSIPAHRLLVRETSRLRHHLAEHDF